MDHWDVVGASLVNSHSIDKIIMKYYSFSSRSGRYSIDSISHLMVLGQDRFENAISIDADILVHCFVWIDQQSKCRCLLVTEAIFIGRL